MHTKYTALVLLGATVAQADLTCLGWAVVNPFLGITCAFKPEPFMAIDDAIAGAAEAAVEVIDPIVEGAVEDLKNLGEFDLTHNPPVLAYNYIDTAVNDGLSAANAGLKDSLSDFVNVTIGVTEGAANTAIKIVEWGTWLDFWYCTLTGAQDKYKDNMEAMNAPDINPDTNRPDNASAHPRMPPQLPMEDAQGVLAKCATEKWQQVTGPLTFNITDPNQKVGSTIFDIASLLVPVGEGAKAGEVVGAAGYDLAVAATEDSSRIVKWLPEEGEGVAGAFDTQEDALAVKQKLMQDENWPAENCAICNNQPSLGGRRGRRWVNELSYRSQRTKRSERILHRRGAAFSMCCKVPDVVEPDISVPAGVDPASLDEDAIETVKVDPAAADAEAPSIMEKYELPGRRAYSSISEMLQVWAEDSLVAPPEYTVFDIAEDGASDLILQDLYDVDTAVIKWSPELQAISESDSFFTQMRTFFELPDDDATFVKLGIRKDLTRSRINCKEWADFSDDATLAPIQKFINQAVKETIDNTKNVLASKLGGKNVRAEAYMLYTPAMPDSTLARFIAHEPHVDGALLANIASDQPGLVIGGIKEEFAATRPPVVSNAFQTIKGTDIRKFTYLEPKPLDATYHAVFGREILENGRVSLIVFSTL